MLPTAEPTQRPVLDRLDVRAVTRWAGLVRSAFATYRSEIDSLNVFPVPDGDTGTNLYLTFDGALDGARSAFERAVVVQPLTLESLSEALAELGARPWQIDLTAQPILEAFVEPHQSADPAEKADS